jgi:hypothetical protein
MAARTTSQTDVVTGRYRGTMYGLVGANQKIFAGAFIALVGGYWVNVTSTTGLEGRVAKALKEVDNTGGAAGAKRVEVAMLGKRWLELVANDTAGSPVTATDLGDEVYWLDNQTITLDDTGRSKSGRAWGFYSVSLGPIDETKVWVEVY